MFMISSLFVAYLLPYCSPATLASSLVFGFVYLDESMNLLKLYNFPPAYLSILPPFIFLIALISTNIIFITLIVSLQLCARMYSA